MLNTGALILDTLVPLASLTVKMQVAARMAVQARSASYSPYSNYAVGAALLHMDGSMTPGCNYENCTLQACCAERCAIVRANSEGRRTAEAIAVYGRSRNPNAVAQGVSLCFPCGLCRQLLVEVADLSQNYERFLVILVSVDEQHVKVLRLADLMPKKFGPDNIGMDVQSLSQMDSCLPK